MGRIDSSLQARRGLNAADFRGGLKALAGRRAPIFQRVSRRFAMFNLRLYLLKGQSALLH
jgi:hypothetical protein